MDQSSLQADSWFKSITCVEMPEKHESRSRVDTKDDRARQHYLKTFIKDGKTVKFWQCGLCLKEFRFQYTLLRHIPTHTDVRNYRCDLCSKAFRQLSTLSQHKATHDNKRQFVCNFCSKSFNRASTLISHKKIHGQVKNHVCPACGKGFHQKGNLRNHMYTHSNARPYKCGVCNKGFNQKSNLVCHKATHVKTKTYFCEVCRESFSTKRELNGHIAASPECSTSNVLVESIKQEDDGYNECNKAQNNDPVVEFVGQDINAVREIPIAQALEIKLDSANQENVPFVNPQPGDHMILTILKTYPSDAMRSSYINDGFLYCLLYRPNSVDPIFCKAIPSDDEMVIVSTNDSPSKLNIFSPLKIIQKYDASGKVVAFLDSDKNAIPLQVDCDEQDNNLNYAGYCQVKEARQILKAYSLRGPQVYPSYSVNSTGSRMNLTDLADAASSLVVTRTVPDNEKQIKTILNPAVRTPRVFIPVTKLNENLKSEELEKNDEDAKGLVVDVRSESNLDLGVTIKEEDFSDEETAERRTVNELMDNYFEIDLTGDDYSSLIQAETGQLSVDDWQDELFPPSSISYRPHKLP